MILNILNFFNCFNWYSMLFSVVEKTTSIKEVKFCLFHLSKISDVCIFQSDLDLWRTIAAVSDDLWNSITWRPAAYLSSRSAFSWHVFPRKICQKNVRTLPYTTGSNVHFANIVVTSKSNSQVLYWTHDSKHLWNSTVFSLSLFLLSECFWWDFRESSL